MTVGMHRPFAPFWQTWRRSFVLCSPSKRADSYATGPHLGRTGLALTAKGKSPTLRVGPSQSMNILLNGRT